VSDEDVPNVQSELERLRTARDLAFEEGRHRERIEGRLNNHEIRLNAINGSIDRGTNATLDLQASIGALHGEITRLTNAFELREALEKDRIEAHKAAEARRTDQLREANEKQISNRSFWIGVGMILVTLFGVIITQTHLLSG
jgi:hypothetical protein